MVLDDLEKIVRGVVKKKGSRIISPRPIDPWTLGPRTLDNTVKQAS